MTVSELIAKLQAMPQDDTVLVYDDRSSSYVDPSPETDTVDRIPTGRPDEPFYYFVGARNAEAVTIQVVTL